jgi:AsmA protein
MDARTAAGSAIELRLSATPRIQGNALQLDDIALHMSQGGNTTLVLSGNAHWHGAADASADLNGKLDQADAGNYAISVHLTPADQANPLLLALKLDGPDNHADVRLPPLALAHWWGQLNDPGEPRLGVPPGDGRIDIMQWQTGSIGIEGLSIQAGTAVPAPSSSATTPAPVETRAR